MVATSGKTDRSRRIGVASVTIRFQQVVPTLTTARVQQGDAHHGGAGRASQSRGSSFPNERSEAANGAGRTGPGAARSSRVASDLNVRSLGDNEFALVHPSCIDERREDYEEGLTIWREGEPDEAREVLRFALEGCGDNLWVHVALGRIALEEDRDPTLARGHFGYAVEITRQAVPRDFSGTLPRDHPANRPFFEAIDGLLACLDALGQTAEGAELRALAARWSGNPGPS